MKRLALSALMLSIVVVWGWTFVVVKEAIAAYGVVPFLAVRYAIATVAIGAFAARRVTRASLTTGGLIGRVLAAAYLFQTFGLRLTTATNSGVITGLFVVFAPVANRLLYGVRTARLLSAPRLRTVRAWGKRWRAPRAWHSTSELFRAAQLTWLRPQPVATTASGIGTSPQRAQASSRERLAARSPSSAEARMA